MNENETISKSIRFPASLWKWVLEYAKENGGRSAASVVREAVKEKEVRTMLMKLNRAKEQREQEEKK